MSSFLKKITLIRIKRRFLRKPAPEILIALYLSLRWKARISIQAGILYPFNLSLGKGVVIRKCQIICSGPILLGDGVFLHDGVILDAQLGRISIGENTEINPYCVLYGYGGLSIGREVSIATHTIIVTANHMTDDLHMPINRQPIESIGIVIEDNVWLAANCVILDGVTIASGAVVAAGAVVNKSVPNNTIVAGIPAKVIRMRGE
jgi:acetyltransferase-like isoleucine patch superfamily enzyme